MRALLRGVALLALLVGTTGCDSPNLVRLVASLRALDGCTVPPTVSPVAIPSMPSGADAGTSTDSGTSGDRLYRVTCGEGQPATLVVCNASNDNCSAPPGTTR